MRRDTDNTKVKGRGEQTGGDVKKGNNTVSRNNSTAVTSSNNHYFYEIENGTYFYIA